jgi:hypothetical protein
MRHLQPNRLVQIAAMLGATLVLAGGTLVTTAGVAFASNAGGGQTCTSLVATADLSAAMPMVTGVLSGCNSNRDGAISAVLDITGAPAPGSIAWTTGKATSLIVLSAVIDFSGGPCPAGDVAADVTLSVGSGPYEGTSGTGVICADISGFPIIALTNFGPVKF